MYNRQVYDQEVFDAEPGLSRNVAGAVAIDGERHIKPDTFVDGLVEALTERGIEIRSGVDVYGSSGRGGRVTTLRTTVGDIEADEIVVAAGAWSGPVTKRITGKHLPLEAGKGYSVSVDQSPPTIKRTMNFIEARCACTPFSDSLRLAGTLEPVSYTHLRAPETALDLVCRLLLDNKNLHHHPPTVTPVRLHNTY